MTDRDTPDFDYERLSRLLAGEMDAFERGEMEREAGEDPELRAALEDARLAWGAVRTPLPVDTDAGWRALSQRIATGTSQVVELPARRRYWPSTGVLLRAAAAAVLVVGAGLVWRGTTDKVPVMVARATAAAEQSEVTLPDGSTVVLAAASRIRTMDGFGTGGTREVELEGEARFTVVHDEQRPFRVRTAGAVIEDLGTEFVVRAIPRLPLRVSVTEGSVSVRRTGTSAGDALVLGPRDVAIVPDTGDLVVSRGVEVAHYEAWTRGQLDFRNVPLGEAIEDLERWFDLEFQVSDPALLARPLNAPFDRRIGADAMLDVLGTVLGVEFERRGRVVTVSPVVRTGGRGERPVAVPVGGGA